ncbi:hypothetical protein [Fluviicola sp.]|uniref:hypothetical protein n=1 Tax=Fluviicola sp. TaxID=1917219 RepID=UPI0031DA1501
MYQIFCIAFLFVVIFSLTPAHYLLRAYFMYVLFLLISLLFPWITFELIINDLGSWNDPYYLGATFIPLSFMMLYKLFDSIIRKRYDRHLHIVFHRNYAGFKGEWLDLFFQLILLFSPLVFIPLGKWWSGVF